MTFDTKYTLFDNFDKLDLSPISTDISAQAFKIENNTSIESSNKFNHSYYNDTKFSNEVVDNVTAPFSFKSNFSGYSPDMFRYLTNKRFYIDIGGQLKHTSKVQFTSNINFAANNLFKYEFFGFDVYFPNTEKLISNNSLLYKNKLDLSDYFTENEYTITEGIFSAKAPFFEPNTPFKNGRNRIIFSIDPFDGKKQFLLLDDLIPGSQTQANFVYEEYNPPFGSNALTNTLRRLLYPFKTPEGQIPKHIYFVANLDKSPNIKKLDSFPEADYTDSVVQIQPTYNYYLESAEERPENLKLEWQLPNAYSYYSFVKRTPESPLYKYFSDIVSLDVEKSKLENFNVKKYYEVSNDSETYLDDESNSEYLKFLNLSRQSTVIFGENFEELSEDVLSIKDIFPYYNQISLPPRSSQLMNKLQNQNLLGLFLSLMGNYFTGPTSANAAIEDRGVHTFSIFDSSISTEDKTNLSLTTLQVLNLSEDILSKSHFFRDAKSIKLASVEINNDSVPVDKALMLQESIQDYCIPKTLDFSSIDKGEKCYSEILAYEVVKYSINSNGEKQFLQNFFIPCYGSKIKNILDTQVFYDKNYIYEVFSISLIVGAEYTSELGIANSNNLFNNLNLAQKQVDEENDKANWSSVDIKGGAGIFSKFLESKPYDNVFDCVAYKVNNEGMEEDEALAQCQTEFSGFNTIDVGNEEVKVFCRPILVRAPYYNASTLLGDEEQKTTILIDNPPLPPDISFNPYKDVDNKVLISLNINYGQRELTPIPVFTSDVDRIIKYRKNQEELNLQPGQVLYKTDDFKGTYRVYKTTTKPTGWNAFSEDQALSINNEQLSAFEDNILPNVDYYYFARFEDIHGNCSNPTSIFHVRIVKEGGFPPYMLVKPYNFLESIEPPKYEKSFKKYLKIELSSGVREYFNLDNLNECNFGYTKLNSSEDLKKYKIRITSKKTGKKIDINLDFNKIMNNTYLNQDLDVKKQSLGKKQQIKTTNDMQAKVEKAGNFEDFENDLAKAPKFDSETQAFLPPSGEDF